MCISLNPQVDYATLQFYPPVARLTNKASKLYGGFDSTYISLLISFITLHYLMNGFFDDFLSGLLNNSLIFEKMKKSVHNEALFQYQNIQSSMKKNFHEMITPPILMQHQVFQDKRMRHPVLNQNIYLNFKRKLQKKF